MNSRLTPFPRTPPDHRRPPLLGRDTELLSIDLFVALDRLVGDPTDVHHLVAALLRQRGHRIAPLYPEIRLRAERRAREAAAAGRNTPDRVAISLAGIGDQLIAELTPLIGDARTVARQAIEREITLEQQLSRAGPGAGPLVAEARERGLPLAYVADTYLPRDLVALLLRSAGLPAGLILVSSHEGVTKADGRLYRQLVDRSGIRPERIVHVGPDPGVDVELAGVAGLRGRYLEPGRNRAAGLLRCGFTRPSALDSVALALAGHRLDPAGRDGSDRSGPPHPGIGDPDRDEAGADALADIGYYAGGPLAAGFVAWLGQIVDDDRPDLVLLADTAGPMVQRLIRVLRPDLPPELFVSVPQGAVAPAHLRRLDGVAGPEHRVLVAGLGWPHGAHERVVTDLGRHSPAIRAASACLGAERPPPTRSQVMLWAFGRKGDDAATGLALRGLPVLEAMFGPGADREAGAGRPGTGTLGSGVEHFARHFGPWLRLDPSFTTAALAEPALRLIERPTAGERRMLGRDGCHPVIDDRGPATPAPRARPSGPGERAPGRAASALVSLLRRRDVGR